MIAHENLRHREQADRDRVWRQDRPALREVRPEGRRDQAHARGGIEERERATEGDGCQQRAAEDVLGLFSPSLPRSGPREENGENRRRQEETDPRKGGSRGVRTGFVPGEAGFDDEDVDVCEQRDADEAGGDWSQVAEKRDELASRQPRAAA